MSESGEGDGTRKTASLPDDIQAELGRKLRTSLRVEEAKPAYLGDEAVPPAFEGYIRQLQGRDRPGRSGLDAVRNALGLNEAENHSTPASKSGAE